jgi:hypothetical protein
MTSISMYWQGATFDDERLTCCFAAVETCLASGYFEIFQLRGFSVSARKNGHRVRKKFDGDAFNRVRTVASERGCFVAGTPVHTTDGPRPIETIQVGDLVLARAEDGGDASYKRVARIFEFEAKVIHAVFYVTGEDMDEIDTVFATGDHPFWVEGESWTRADGLYSDMQARLADGRLATIASQRLVYRSDTPDVGWVMSLGFGNHDADTGQFVDFRGAAPEVNWGGGRSVANQLSSLASGDDGAMLRKVYNFEVEDFHTCHVGTLGVWVRDTGC